MNARGVSSSSPQSTVPPVRRRRSRVAIFLHEFVTKKYDRAPYKADDDLVRGKIPVVKMCRVRRSRSRGRPRQGDHTGVLRLHNQAMDSWGACPAPGSATQDRDSDSVEGRSGRREAPHDARGGHGLVMLLAPGIAVVPATPRAEPASRRCGGPDALLSDRLLSSPQTADSPNAPFTNAAAR
jgi:hypothetical protein